MIDLLQGPRKAAEAKRLRERQQETRDAAYVSALELCEAIGPAAMDEAYGRSWTTVAGRARDSDGGVYASIATAFARATYNPEAETSAVAGALEGFKRYRAK